MFTVELDDELEDCSRILLVARAYILSLLQPNKRFDVQAVVRQVVTQLADEPSVVAIAGSTLLDDAKRVAEDGGGGVAVFDWLKTIEADDATSRLWHQVNVELGHHMYAIGKHYSHHLSPWLTHDQAVVICSTNLEFLATLFA